MDKTARWTMSYRRIVLMLLTAFEKSFQQCVEKFAAEIATESTMSKISACSQNSPFCPIKTMAEFLERIIPLRPRSPFTSLSCKDFRQIPPLPEIRTRVVHVFAADSSFSS